LVGAQGVAVYFDNNVLSSVKHQQADIQDLIEWLESKTYNVFILIPTKNYPEAEKLKMSSGLLALSISKVPQNYILWFRPK